MWFEQVKEWITWFFNLPLPIAGISVGTAGVFLLILFSKTSLGKKLYNSVVKSVKDAVDTLNEYKAYADTKIEELRNNYEEKLQIVNAKNEALEKLLITVSENINNKKIKEVVNKYCENSNEIIAICDVVDDKVIEAKEQAVSEANKVIEDYKAKLEAEFNERKAKYEKEFLDKSKELDEQIAKYKALAESKVEEINGVVDYVQEEISKITEE